MTKGTPRFREMLDIAHKLGFSDVGWRTNGHFRVSHPNGVYDISGTPGDLRGDRNAVADMERISGRKLPRANAGRYRHEGQRSGFVDTRPSRRAGESAELVERASVLRAEFAELALSPVSRSAAAVGRRVVREYSRLVREAESLYVVLPPLY